MLLVQQQYNNQQLNVIVFHNSNTITSNHKSSLKHSSTIRIRKLKRRTCKHNWDTWNDISFDNGFSSTACLHEGLRPHTGWKLKLSENSHKRELEIWIIIQAYSTMSHFLLIKHKPRLFSSSSVSSYSLVPLQLP